MLRWLTPKAGLQLEPTTMPMTEAATAARGSRQFASQSDHVHQRLTSAVSGVLNASGEATVVFGRTFDVKPVAAFTYEEGADNPPLTFKVKSWTQDGNGKYTGCVIKAYRGRTLPATITLLTALVSFNVFGGDASGVTYHFIAIQPG